MCQLLNKKIGGPHVEIDILNEMEQMYKRSNLMERNNDVKDETDYNGILNV